MLADAFTEEGIELSRLEVVVESESDAYIGR